jgi:RNase adapter protein RapZ
VTPISVQPPHVVIVTGVSGAGKSTALRSLEDQGYFCVDNLPTVLAPEVVEVCAQGGILRVALGIDVRVGTFLGTIGTVLDALSERAAHNASPSPIAIVYCDASDEAILRRFSETRRPHALASEGTGAFAVLDGVRLERERLAPLRARATSIIDTTHLSVHELRRRIFEQFGGEAGQGSRRMAVRIVSFGFKYGMPIDADLVFDVRFLPNPYFVKELRAKSGLADDVRDYVLTMPDTREFLEHTLALLAFVIPKYEREGKSYLTIAIGCTGGRHRSVAVAEEIAKRFRGLAVHRDILRSEAQDAGSTGKFLLAEEQTMQISPIPNAVRAKAMAAEATDIQTEVPAEVRGHAASTKTKLP